MHDSFSLNLASSDVRFWATLATLLLIFVQNRFLGGKKVAIATKIKNF